VVNFRRTLLRFLKPPEGCRVRKVLGLLLVGFGVYRLITLGSSVTELTWLPFYIYGIGKIVAGLAILCTNHQHRLTRYGYVATWLTVGVSVMAFADAFPTPNLMWLYGILTWIAVGEAISRRECL
jgi:hypothetical protein